MKSIRIFIFGSALIALTAITANTGSAQIVTRFNSRPIYSNGRVYSGIPLYRSTPSYAYPSQRQYTNGYQGGVIVAPSQPYQSFRPNYNNGYNGSRSYSQPYQNGYHNNGAYNGQFYSTPSQQRGVVIGGAIGNAIGGQRGGNLGAVIGGTVAQ